MAYTDFTHKIILNTFGKCKLVPAEVWDVGDLLTADGYIADAEDSKPAAFVAIESAVAADVTNSKPVWVALAAIVKKRDTGDARGDVYTRGDHSGTAGTTLYLDGGVDQGEAVELAGTIPQVVGRVLEQDTALLCPTMYLTGIAAAVSTLTASEAVNFAKTLAVTGVVTLTAAPVLNGGGTITAGKFLSGAPIKMTETSKNDDATLTVAESGLILVTVDNKTMTLPTVTGNRGLEYIIIPTCSVSTGVTVDGSGAETINGQPNVVLLSQYEILHIRAGATEWNIL